MSEIYRGDDSDIVELMRENDALEAKFNTAHARIAELEAALDPFSDFAEAWDTPPTLWERSTGKLITLRSGAGEPNGRTMCTARHGCREHDVYVTLGHFRAARTARRGKAETGEPNRPRRCHE